MKKILLPLFLLLTFVVSAQLNNRFYSNGSAIFVSKIGAYGSNIFLEWRQIQKPSTYNWSYADGLVQANQSAGLRTMITLKCAHPINADDSTSGTCAYLYDNGTSDNNSNWPLVSADTTKWKNFVNALVDRYDGDGTNDMTGLIYPVRQWHIIGQEWQRVWCSQYPNSSLASAQEFVKLVNMTYKVIKTKQPSDTISFAGIDVRNEGEAFYDGYFPSSQTTFRYDGNCSGSPVYLTKPQLASVPSFLPDRSNVMYIFKNALFDEIDLHEYGNWQHIPDCARWAKDSTFGKPVAIMEGGGPFCKVGETLYHSASDTDGRLPAPLVRDNSSYVVYYFITGLASGVRKLHWNPGPEYGMWGAWWGDLNLLSINLIPKPSAYTYRFLAKTIFSNANADTVVRISELDSNLYHYQVQQLPTLIPFIDVAWSTNLTDSIVVSGSGTLYRWDIPTTCDSLYPTYCDSLVQQSSVNVSSSYAIHLYNRVPVFYSWNNVLTASENISNADNYSVKIYPNPFSMQTTLRTDKFFKDATLTVYNSFGQQVKQIKNISGQTVTLFRDNLASGLYFVRLTTPSPSGEGWGEVTEKLVITDN